VHPNGNPHYWLDPRNGGVVARTIASALGKIDPAHAANFASRAEAFASQADEEEAKGTTALAALQGRNIITYHASWVYFAHAYGLSIVGTVEPVPGIPPTGKHLAELIDMIKGNRVGFLLQEPYFSDDAGEFLNREAQVKVVHASPSCDTVDAGSYLAHFDQIIREMTTGQGRP
jgi:ABC-type Zn uptake system ZnuABC Zn-binding protein ZnuA